MKVESNNILHKTRKLAVPNLEHIFHTPV